MPRKVREQLLGEVALRAGLVTRPQLEECLALQERRRDQGKKVPRIGELLAHKGYLSRPQVKALLQGKYARQGGRFGEIAVRLQLVDAGAVEAALAEQARLADAGERHLALGQILRDRGQLEVHHVRAVLQAQGKTVARCRHCRKKFTIKDFRPGRVRCKRCGRLLVEEPVADRDAPEGDAAPAEEGTDIVTRPADRRRLRRGEDVQGYRIRELLGEDMTGSLYRAREKGGRVVTFKLLDSESLHSPKVLKAFLAVAQKSASLNHPAIKRLFAVGKAGEHYFVAMEYVEGDSLRQVLSRAQKLPVPMVLKVATQVLDALIHAAEKGLIHRDLRPSNVLIAEGGQVKVSGFGVPVDLGGNLRLFARGKRDSACYLAPELVVDGAEVDSRADIFGLGCLLYHLLSGRPPLRGRSPVDVMLYMSERGIRPLRKAAEAKIPPELARVVTQMIQLEPGDRYQSLYQLERELQVIAADYPELDIG